MLGITIKPTIGIGDALQFSSLPENYFRATGLKLADLSEPWFFDHNPFVVRKPAEAPAKVREMWNFSPKQFDWPNPRTERRPAVYLSNAEIWAASFGVPCKLNRPRLYMFEDYPYEDRTKILFHLDGISHGTMPDHIIAHVVKKYGQSNLRVIGANPPATGLPHVVTPTLWDLAREISTARMVIGLDSGPAWIAACFPDIVVKKVRTKPDPKILEHWVPLDISSIHAHWDDRCHQIFNVTDEDIGFTMSYRKI